jgi:hypothetical protein
MGQKRNLKSSTDVDRIRWDRTRQAEGTTAEWNRTELNRKGKSWTE